MIYKVYSNPSTEFLKEVSEEKRQIEGANRISHANK